MPTENATTSRIAAAGAAPKPVESRPLAIEVRDLRKSFRIPTHRVDSLKERVVRPFAARDYRELKALDGISFEIHQGEFFGIVGRNGSGKSTLLKLLASIYRADGGTIRMAGRLAPFIELGVGFNHDLSARENVVLNGVMMGLTPREMRSRLDAIIEFAELEEFVDLKLKNYSSGMLVRLAFSVMLQADADVLLIDEVLAVGDAAFQQKCADAFYEMKQKGKTIVLVTHEMATVESYCHRAMLIGGGRIQDLGDPGEIGSQYLRLNFEEGAETAGGGGEREADEMRLVEIRLVDEAGAPQTTVEQGTPIRVRLELEAKVDVNEMAVGFILANADGIGVSEFGSQVEGEGVSNLVRAGQRVKLELRLDNPLVTGRYFLHCGVSRKGGATGGALYVPNALDFVVYGNDQTRGLVSLSEQIRTSVEERGGR
jgi:ABC-type polysaccharide/polyol phosphate transport system ATPase subunit